MSHYITIFHANLNDAFLHEKDYERVIRASHETIFTEYNRRGITGFHRPGID